MHAIGANRPFEHRETLGVQNFGHDSLKIGRAHVCTPVTNAHLVCRLLLEKHKLPLSSGTKSCLTARSTVPPLTHSHRRHTPPRRLSSVTRSPHTHPTTS